MPRHARRAPIGLLSGLPLCKRGIEGDLFRGQKKIPPVPPLIKGGNVFLWLLGCGDFAGCVQLRRSSESDTSGVARHEKREALQAKSFALVEESRNPNFCRTRNSNAPFSATSSNAGRKISRENTHNRTFQPPEMPRHAGGAPICLLFNFPLS